MSLMDTVNTYPIIRESEDFIDPNGDDLDLVDSVADDGTNHMIDDAAEEMEDAEADLLSGFSDYESEGFLIPNTLVEDDDN